MNSKYYLTEVDKNPQSIFCYHNLMGETFIEPHSHNKGQFLYTEGGVVHVKTDSRMYYLPARHYMWIPPGVRHAIYPSSPKVIMKNLYFPMAVNPSGFYKKEGIYPINNLLMELLLYTKNWNGDLIKSQKNKYAIVYAFKALIEQTVSKSLHLELPHPTDGRLINIIKYLTDNIQQEHLLPKLASNFSMTDKSLYRLFKKDLGMSFIKYYTQLRVFKSLEYLMNSDYNISEIANMVGYSSLPTFSNTFTKVMGKRPSEYRKTNEIYLEA
ncbi:AraC family transcriptional regulator [Lacinutrix sp. C3R15]|uniref:AraC family transcriptional regulator n=1 Tax=Flavobacteriaceae TaxID=49546 RepID=UPI001C090EE3|nr:MULTISPECIES: AraC family transcriptional regulator [Flavobacteriaceae]MBU2940553.1 AraC family transcriptional regulator [Lacinutrix sp. C3R15]MDO6623873.1 AraC family transcriptional regulator [Oceanihabitans sp. 1_MG-2023]